MKQCKILEFDGYNYSIAQIESAINNWLAAGYTIKGVSVNGASYTVFLETI